MKPITDEHVQKILDSFDFDAVHNHMNQLPIWTWPYRGLGIPTADELKVLVKELLKGRSLTKYHRSAGGGFYCSLLSDPDRIQLSFIDERSERTSNNITVHELEILL